MPPYLTLSIIRENGSFQGKVWHPPLHHGFVDNEKEAFRSQSTTVAYFTYYMHIHIYHQFFSLSPHNSTISQNFYDKIIKSLRVPIVCGQDFFSPT